MQEQKVPSDSLDSGSARPKHDSEEAQQHLKDLSQAHPILHSATILGAPTSSNFDGIADPARVRPHDSTGWEPELDDKKGSALKLHRRRNIPPTAPVTDSQHSSTATDHQADQTSSGQICEAERVADDRAGDASDASALVLSNTSNFSPCSSFRRSRITNPYCPAERAAAPDSVSQAALREAADAL